MTSQQHVAMMSPAPQVFSTQNYVASSNTVSLPGHAIVVSQAPPPTTTQQASDDRASVYTPRTAKQLGVCLLVGAVLVLLLAVAELVVSSTFPQSYGIMCISIFFFISGSVAITSSKKVTTCRIKATLVFALLAALCAFILFMISVTAINNQLKEQEDPSYIALACIKGILTLLSLGILTAAVWLAVMGLKTYPCRKPVNNGNAAAAQYPAPGHVDQMSHAHAPSTTAVQYPVHQYTYWDSYQQVLTGVTQPVPLVPPPPYSSVAVEPRAPSPNPPLWKE